MTDMVFADELPDPAEDARTRTLDPWLVMIVDDDPAVHQVTQLVMADFEFAGRKLQFLNAYNGAEARDLLRDRHDIALILLDVVMESEHAGLDVARFIREELRNANSPHAAIAAGYDRAWGTILDSNVTTLIAGLALFAFGSGPVKGFAVVLCLGILTSIFSAVMVSRAIANLYYGRRRRLESISIGQIWRPAASKR